MTIDGVKTIGLIGAGHIGSQIARAAMASGYDVVISNSRGPETLTERRDGNIAALDDDSVTSSELLQSRLPGANVVKAFNHIYARQITSDGTPSRSPNRRALAIAGDDSAAKTQVAELIDEFGFDVVDVGPLADSWRIQPGTPGYVERLNAKELTAALASVERGR